MSRRRFEPTNSRTRSGRSTICATGAGTQRWSKDEDSTEAGAKCAYRKSKDDIYSIETRVNFALSIQIKETTFSFCAYNGKSWHFQDKGSQILLNFISPVSTRNVWIWGKFFIMQDIRIKFKIWRVTFLKFILPLKCYGMELRFSANKANIERKYWWNKV